MLENQQLISEDFAANSLIYISYVVFCTLQVIQEALKKTSTGDYDKDISTY
jgi:hypothetical protein